MIRFIALMLASASLYAAPFVETSESPSSDVVTSYEFRIDAGGPTTVAPTATAGGTRGYLDVVALTGTGNHQVTVSACNIWGCSPESPPFLFSTSVPSTPSATGLVPIVP